MQGPWSYDDSMGGYTIIAADQPQRCTSCGARTAHAKSCAEDCPARPD